MKKICFFVFLFIVSINLLGVDYGTKVGEFNSVPAYSNGTTSFVSSDYNNYNGINTGMKWQCVEFVNRYYAKVYNMNLKDTEIYGNANTYFQNAGQAGLKTYANGGTTAPEVGDIICSNGGTYGHVGIVRSVSTNSITVIHQNWSNSTADNEKVLSRSGNNVGTFNSTYPVQGWVRMPNSTPTCSFSVSVEGTAKTTLVEGWKFWEMSNKPSFYKVYANLNNLPTGHHYSIYLGDEYGNIIPNVHVLGDQSSQEVSFNFEAKSPYNNGAKYTLVICAQGDTSQKWHISPYFYMSSLPILSISVEDTPFFLTKNDITVKWTVTGGIPSLTDRGWTNNIRLQWYQNSNYLDNIQSVPVSNKEFKFKIPQTLNLGSFPGCGFKISGSNTDNTSIKEGYVFGFSQSFCVNIDYTNSEELYEDYFVILPSLADEVLSVRVDNSLIGSEIKIFNTQGVQVKNQNLISSTTKIDISDIPKGLYFMSIDSFTRKPSKKFVKK